MYTDQVVLAFSNPLAALAILVYLVLCLTKSFAELVINVIVEIDRYPNPDAVQKDKDEPEILDLIVGAEGRGPVLCVVCVCVWIKENSG